MYHYIERKIESQLIYLAKHFPVVVIGGARQTGKTALVRHLFDDEKNVFSKTTRFTP